MGSAVVITNPRGDVLVMRRSYPPHDWVLPGGLAEAGESPVETATREVFEEMGLHIRPDRLTGVYYQADHRLGEFIHFMFAYGLDGSEDITIDPSEVAEYGFFGRDDLPEPMSLSTRRRLLDGLEPEVQRLPVDLPLRSET